MIARPIEAMMNPDARNHSHEQRIRWVRMPSCRSSSFQSPYSNDDHAAGEFRNLPRYQRH